tara:strand:- start:497 stop:790 length:294 start_codon:yes stop_codon:yes gene_type:complete
MTKDNNWITNKGGRDIEFGVEQMEEFMGMVKTINKFFKLSDDLPITKLRVEWANGFGTEIHAGHAGQSSDECECNHSDRKHIECNCTDCHDIKEGRR